MPNSTTSGLCRPCRRPCRREPSLSSPPAALDRIRTQHRLQYFLIMSHMYVLVLTQPSICLFYPNGTIVSNWWPPALRIESRSPCIQICLRDSCTLMINTITALRDTLVVYAIIWRHESSWVFMRTASFTGTSDNERRDGTCQFFFFFFMIAAGWWWQIFHHEIIKLRTLHVTTHRHMFIFPQCEVFQPPHRSTPPHPPPSTLHKLIFSHG